jgi:hypothetical protein
MKTTIELPDQLFIAAKRRAAEDRSTLRAIVERGVRAQLQRPRAGRKTRTGRSTIRWVTVDGGLPPEVDLQDRAAMHDWLRARR